MFFLVLPCGLNRWCKWPKTIGSNFGHVKDHYYLIKICLEEWGGELSDNKNYWHNFFGRNCLLGYFSVLELFLFVLEDDDDGDGCILCPSTSIHKGILESEVELASNRGKNEKAKPKKGKEFFSIEKESWSIKRYIHQRSICLRYKYKKKKYRYMYI